MNIIGAGMAGLIAGYMFPKAIILERESDVPDHHRAVLRFREHRVSDVTGIPFKEVKVYKGIWDNGPKLPNIVYMNEYSKKVTGKYISRSISNLDSAIRYVAPSNFHRLMADDLHSRIRYNTEIVETPLSPCISTMPMHIIAKITNIELEEKFQFEQIYVERWTVADCDLYQTIYYPNPETSVYRASLCGEIMMIESKGELTAEDRAIVVQSFGLSTDDTILLDNSSQRYGKIAPIDEATRRKFVYNLTTRTGIFSLGRFATWRNILLDDVVYDCERIKEFINKDEYFRSNFR
jgi:hypothetical protein